MSFADLKQKLLSYISEKQLHRFEEAFEFACSAHEGQSRVSGEDYIIHPVAVAYILADLELDLETIIAALLHDVVEDTEVNLDDISRRFGTEVAVLVDGVTKLRRLEQKTKTEQQAENIYKMFLAMAKDIRVVLIKLADRLHNMRTLSHLRLQKRKDIAKETLEIFAPLAHRLGIFQIQSELEDLCFRYLEPERYQEITTRVAKKRSEREAIIQKAINVLTEKLAEVDITADIQGRPKHFYSIYRKMDIRGKDFSEIYDLIAVRIIVDTVKDCYGTLGVIHTLWKPIPGRFKDYIAMPKPNMYQSLHTSVIGVSGEPIEIQIRTWEMHQTAEYGIAAHWRYKEGGKSSTNFEEKLAWLRQVLEWQQELRDAEEFMDSLKLDLFSDQVFVFTPKGDVIELPSGATPIDFAYRIHTEVGHRCVGAKVNGRIVPLSHQLTNGDIVEILTTKVANGPSRDWLNIVKTSSARSRIRQWFKREQRDENIERGEELLRKEVVKLEYDASVILNSKESDIVEELLEERNYISYDDLLAAIGFGSESAPGVARKLVERYKEIFEPREVLHEKVVQEQDEKPAEGIRVSGVDNALLRLASCCSPVPGDDIIGYITRGKGVSIHRKDCPNVSARIEEESERFIEVAWEERSDLRAPVQLQVTTYVDKPGVLHDIMGVISERNINIIAFHAKTDTINQNVIVYMTVEVQNVSELEAMMNQVKRLSDVHSIQRTRF